MGTILSKTLDANCTQALLSVATDDVNLFGTSGTLTITEMTGSNSVSIPVVLGSDGQAQVLVTAADLGLDSLSGVFQLKFLDGSGKGLPASLLGTCAIDCCLASLTHKGITCDCDCEDCDKYELNAHRVLLLLHAAEYAVNVDNLQTAIEEYNKATQLCDGGCDCNC